MSKYFGISNRAETCMPRAAPVQQAELTNGQKVDTISPVP